MPLDQFILHNEEYYLKDTPLFNHSNRAFAFGDALFETIHANGTVMQFWDDHMQRLIRGMKILEMDIPEIFLNGSLEKFIVRLLNKNKLLKGARVRITVYRDAKGKYTPADNKVSYIVASEKLDQYEYILNKQGLLIDTYPEIKKPVNQLSCIKSTNALLFTKAGMYARKNGFDDIVILNKKNHIVEGLSSNIFFLVDNTLYTPPVSDGCVEGIIRKQILEISTKLGLAVSFEASLKLSVFNHAEEIFLTNAISGLRWVAAYKKKRYYHFTCKKIIEELNRFAGINS